MGRSTREVVTLSVGHYSNFVTSHWLNLQEASFVYDKSFVSDLNHDVLFREGVLPNNLQTYVPRILIIDAKGSLGSLKSTGSLYDSPHDPSLSDTLWSGKVEIHCHEKEEKNEFLKALEKDDLQYMDHFDDHSSNFSINGQDGSMQTYLYSIDLRNKVNVWSDFLRPHLHPKAIYILDDVYHQDVNSQIRKMKSDEIDCPGISERWSFCDGVSLLSNERVEDEIVDRIRLLAEDCDSLQGFHFLSDCHDGMGGISAVIGEYLADDFGSKDVFSFLSSPPFYKPRSALEMNVFLTNVIQSYTKILEFSSIVVPLSLETDLGLPSSVVSKWPYLSYQEKCPYECSSILASFLDTISVPWRLKSDSSLCMCYISSLLTPLNRKIVGGNFSFPLGINDFEEYLNEPSVLEEKMHFRPICGFFDEDTSKISEFSTIRGVLDKKSGKFKDKSESSWKIYEYILKSKDINYVQRYVSSARDPLKTHSPFPQIFSSDIDPYGCFKKSNDAKFKVMSVSSLANLYQSDVVGRYLHSLYSRSSKINVSALPTIAIGDLEKNSWVASLEDFLTFIKCYGGRTLELESDSVDSD